MFMSQIWLHSMIYLILTFFKKYEWYKDGGISVTVGTNGTNFKIYQDVSGSC